MKKLILACAVITSLSLASCQGDALEEIEIIESTLDTDPDDEEPGGH